MRRLLLPLLLITLGSPAAAQASVLSTVSGGTLTVTGDAADDRITIGPGVTVNGQSFAGVTRIAVRSGAGADDASNGLVFNVGGLEPIAHRSLVELLVSVAGSGRYQYVEWPPEKKAIDIGDFYADSSLIERTLGWRPVTLLREGLERTLNFYRTHAEHYLPPATSQVASL